MKILELAKSLRILADLLENSPDVPLEKLRLTTKDTMTLTSGQMAVSLSTLVELSRIDKRQWLDFINELGFKIETRPRDASRDLIGKLLTYLESNEAAREQLKTKAALKGSQASPELMKALSSLLKDTV